MTLLKDSAWIDYSLCWAENLPNIRRLTESGSWTVEMSLLVDHKYGKRKIGNLKTRKSEIKAQTSRMIHIKKFFKVNFTISTIIKHTVQ